MLPLRRVGDLSEAVEEEEEEDVVPMALLRMSKMKPGGRKNRLFLSLRGLHSTGFEPA